MHDSMECDWVVQTIWWPTPEMFIRDRENAWHWFDHTIIQSFSHLISNIHLKVSSKAKHSNPFSVRLVLDWISDASSDPELIAMHMKSNL